jgi:putative ABC transport system permease protein
MPLSAHVYFYMRRLRSHPVQEALAGLGIAAGVALVFAVQVANGSITSDSGHVVHSIVGVADLQVRARDSAGFDQGYASRVSALPGVRLAAPVLDVDGTVVGPRGRSAVVQIASANASLPAIAGVKRNLEQAHLTPREPNLPGVLLPRATAHALGVTLHPSAGIPQPAPVVTLRVRGRAVRANVISVLGAEDVGALADALAVIAPLESLQQIAGLPNRISQILVKSQPGKRNQVRRELDALVGGRLNVAPATADVQLLGQATVPSDEATGFFAFVSGLVGVLLAFSAMLLSTPERRRVIADLRIQGTRPRDLAQLLMFQALCLGLVASFVGIVIGDLLSRSIFHQSAGYLALAFPLGTQTVIGWQPVLLALLGGVVATCLAACPPLLDLRRSRAVDAVYFDDGEPGQALSGRARVRLFAAAVVLAGVAVAAPLLLGPSTAVVAIVCLGFAALLAIPLTFTLVLRVADALATRPHGPNMLLMATRTLRATTARSLALAATGAIAVYGTVAANGAHNDLLKGLYRDYSQYVSTASLWVTNPGDYLATNTFQPGDLSARIAGLPSVAGVRDYQGGFLDAYGRRIWLIARSPAADSMLPPQQVVAGSARAADERLRAGGWIAASAQIAHQQHARIGGWISLPTPSGTMRYRLAATTTNLGWSPGAIVLNQNDYRRAWHDTSPTALEIDVRPGVSVAAAETSVQRALGPASALRVQTSPGRANEADALAREGLDRLTQIALLLTIAAVLAMAAAMGASMWQRRPSLSSLRIQSFRPSQLRLILLFESGLVLATGCLAGAIAGIYGHALIDLYLRSVTGFPAPFAMAVPQGLETIAAIVGAALLVLAGPGVVASRVPPSLALQEQG